MNKQHGFTLLEVMVATVILSVGILSIVGLQYTIVNGNTNSNVVTQELGLAQRIMDETKAKHLSDIKNDTLSKIGLDGQPGGIYDVEIFISSPLGEKFSRFITIKVKREGGIGGHEIVLRSLTGGRGV